MNMPDMAIINSKARFMLVNAFGIGIGAQEIRDSERAIIGASVNKMGDEGVGFIVSFVISFSPSAMG